MSNLHQFTGIKEIVAVFIDGSTRLVKVRAIPMRRMREVAAAYAEESNLIELTTGLTPEEVDNLHPDSHNELIAAARELNGERFFAWTERMLQVSADLAPISGKLPQISAPSAPVWPSAQA